MATMKDVALKAVEMGKAQAGYIAKLEAEIERLRKIEYAANAAYNYWAGRDEDLSHRMKELKVALGGE